MYIDHSVYPDVDDPPTMLETDYDKADYVHRICTAWDFHIFPERETFELFSLWKDIFDRFPIPLSPGYHAFRMTYGWEPVPVPPGLRGPVPYYVHLDRLEGRGPDPCAHLI
jgi:hypothetical protein